ncbi:hypothetical protein DRW03_08840 [Corallococcus sp. H22C18031201]|nr:hypothetical protein DRW03_08840 [Corallococcus sp. H22C18031201]
MPDAPAPPAPALRKAPPGLLVPLTRDALEGMAWGAVWSLLPLGILMMLLPAGCLGFFIRLLVRTSSRRYGLMGMVGVAVATAALAPAVPLTRGMARPLRAPLSGRVLPLPVLLEELRAQGLASSSKLRREARDVAVTLPSHHPTYAELDAALRSQAALKLDDFASALDASLLWGVRPERFTIVEHAASRARRP